MAIIGSIIGDIIGSQYEDERCENPSDCVLFTKRCSFTDDTVMSLAVKLATDTDIPFDIAFRILGRQHPYAGYAGMFEEWLFSDSMRAYGSWGNGSAMRVSYIGEYYDDLEDVIKYARKSAEVTHNSEEGIKGAISTAVCVWLAKHKKSKQEIYDFILSEYPSSKYKWTIDKSIDEIKDNYEWEVSCQDCVPVAMRCFYESEDYESFIRNVLKLDCDADTLCAIGGGVAEEFYGRTDLDNLGILSKYLTRDLFNVFQGKYNFIIKHHNRSENSPSCYWGRTGSNTNNGFCPVIKRNAYKFSPSELLSDDVKDLLNSSKEPEILAY